jgi:hypothetical protein
MTAALIWLFGAAAWGSLCNFPAWTILFVERWRVKPVPLVRDRFALGRLGMMLVSFGIGVGSWQRGASFINRPDEQIGLLLSFFGWLPHPLPEWSPFLWSGSLTLAEGIFVWIAALNAEAVGRAPVAWRVYLAGMAVWAVAVPVFFGGLG